MILGEPLLLGPYTIHTMRFPRIQLTLWAMMIVVAVAAVWLFIIVEAIVYQARYLGNHSAWDAYL